VTWFPPRPRYGWRKAVTEIRWELAAAWGLVACLAVLMVAAGWPVTALPVILTLFGPVLTIATVLLPVRTMRKRLGQ
jgi:hypothetical protein